MCSFEALADPTRRRIVELLGTHERSAGEIAGAFDVSRPAVSRHLRVLRETGLVEARSAGQRQIYSLRRDALDEIADWVDRVRVGRAQRLDALALEVRRAKKPSTITKSSIGLRTTSPARSRSNGRNDSMR
jgi:DNA-binding transcriptional ArsR family regulator